MAVLAQLVDDVVVNKFELKHPATTIGRHPDCVIQIDDAAISANHAIITLEKSQYLDGCIELFVEDLDSKNGSFINNQPLNGRRQLSNNDVLRFGWNEFKLMEADQQSLESTALMLQ